MTKNTKAVTGETKELNVYTEPDRNEVETITSTEVIDGQAVVSSLPTTVIDNEVVAEGFKPSIFEESIGEIFSTVRGNDRATNIMVYNAINNTEYSVSDFINQEIEVANLVAHPIDLVDSDTGEITKTTRIILISPEGEGYHSVASGVVNSLQKLIGIVGSGPWEPALTIKPVKVKTRNKFETIVLKVVG